jgi:hypothetical protein
MVLAVRIVGLLAMLMLAVGVWNIAVEISSIDD